MLTEVITMGVCPRSATTLRHLLCRLVDDLIDYFMDSFYCLCGFARYQAQR